MGYRKLIRNMIPEYQLKTLAKERKLTHYVECVYRSFSGMCINPPDVKAKRRIKRETISTQMEMSNFPVFYCREHLFLHENIYWLLFARKHKL